MDSADSPWPTTTGTPPSDVHPPTALGAERTIEAEETGAAGAKTGEAGAATAGAENEGAASGWLCTAIGFGAE